jgi:hypothetical protein
MLEIENKVVVAAPFDEEAMLKTMVGLAMPVVVETKMERPA